MPKLFFKKIEALKKSPSILEIKMEYRNGVSPKFSILLAHLVPFNANKTKSQNSLTSITRTNFIISQSEPKHLTCRIIMNTHHYSS